MIDLPKNTMKFFAMEKAKIHFLISKNQKYLILKSILHLILEILTMKGENVEKDLMLVSGELIILMQA